MEEMQPWQAIILGIVEGVTEYLPISSTGHLILAQRAMRIPESNASDAYAICIQSGAIIAVLGLYWRRVREMLVGLAGKVGIGQGSHVGFRLGVNIVVAFLPAAVIGLLFHDIIEKKLLSLWPIVAAWLVGGIAILWVTFRRPTQTRKGGLDLDQLTWRMALVVGFIQCLAMWPGTSRSLVTIVGGVLVGLRLAAAVEFNFLLGVVTLLAATVYQAHKAGPDMVQAYGWSPMILGSIAAWISAVVAVKWMVQFLQQHDMAIFGYYRVTLALIVGGCLLAGILTASKESNEEPLEIAVVPMQAPKRALFLSPNAAPCISLPLFEAARSGDHPVRRLNRLHFFVLATTLLAVVGMSAHFVIGQTSVTR